MHILWTAELRSKYIHKHFEVLRSFCKVTREVTEDRIQLPAKDKQCVIRFLLEVTLLTHPLG